MKSTSMFLYGVLITSASIAILLLVSTAIESNERNWSAVKHAVAGVLLWVFVYALS